MPRGGRRTTRNATAMASGLNTRERAIVAAPAVIRLEIIPAGPWAIYRRASCRTWRVVRSRRTVFQNAQNVFSPKWKCRVEEEGALFPLFCFSALMGTVCRIRGQK
jgi:hypothetical protein